MKEYKIKILLFIDYYLPGFKAGGPIRTISNFVEQLGDSFDIRIVTRNHDFKSTEKYQEVQSGEWNLVGKAKVLYLPDRRINIVGVKKLLERTPHDVIYLNSFFSPRLTLIPLLANRFRRINSAPVIIAPRGEFSRGSLGMKSLKKKCYIHLVNAINLYNSNQWQASSSKEKSDIERHIRNANLRMNVAPNFLPPDAENKAKKSLNDLENRNRDDKHNVLKIVFLSRIHPTKNLLFLLKAIKQSTPDIQLAIYGPIEDPEYWIECKDVINSFDERINVNYFGEVLPSDVHQVFKSHDLFIFPTRGENFGHVIFESLLAGTPVIISDQTQWTEQPNGVINVFPLESTELWVNEINKWGAYSKDELIEKRKYTLEYILSYLNQADRLKLNSDMFLSVVRNSKQNKRA